MKSFLVNLNKNKLKFIDIQKKLQKHRKIITFFNFFSKIDKKGSDFSKEDFAFFFSFFFCTNILGLLLIFGNELFMMASTQYYFLFFLVILSNFLTIPFILIGFNVNTKYLLQKFSKKQLLMIRLYGYKNDKENVLLYTLERLKIDKNDFKDITSFYNENKDELDSFKIFFIIKRKLTKQFKKSKLSDIELKNSIEYFLNNLKILCPIEQRRQLNEIDAIISNKDNKLNNTRKKIIF